MDMIWMFKALIMGVVEGLTEFLPISSTGHLILAGSVLGFVGEKTKVFEIVIQAGAILAVCWEFRHKLGKVFCGMLGDTQSRKFVGNVAIAFLPAAIMGLLFAKKIKTFLFAPIPVATAFIVGALFILWAEHRHSENKGVARIDSIDHMTALDALKVGIAQVFALIPGTSRSGATIIGGMLFGISRKVATEFSFYLAIPTLFAATLYSLYKDRALLSMTDVPLFSVGLVASFISAFFCIRWLLRYVSTHDFLIFAWYRIVFGVVILLSAYSGLVVWAE